MILDAYFLLQCYPDILLISDNCSPSTSSAPLLLMLLHQKDLANFFLKPPPNLSLLFNLFNNSTPENSSHTDNVDSKCYDIEEIKKLKTIDRKKSPSVVHLNACSLSNNFQDLAHLLKCTNKNFDIIVISETRITKATSQLCNINLKNYCNLN